MSRSRVRSNIDQGSYFSQCCGGESITAWTSLPTPYWPLDSLWPVTAHGGATVSASRVAPVACPYDVAMPVENRQSGGPVLLDWSGEDVAE